MLVTGGTRGIGRAVGLAFGELGAHVVLTHRWSSVDEEELRRAFAEVGAPLPQIIEADVASDEDLPAVLDALRRTGDHVDLFVSNVAVVLRGEGRFTERGLRQSLQWTTWPLERYVEAIREEFGEPPRRVVAMSSDGHEHFYPGYDYVAASKAALEALARRIARRYPGMQCNVLRARQVQTASFEEMFGERARELIARFSDLDLAADEVADAVVALCSGQLDAFSGEVLVVDRGATFHDNLVATGPVLLGQQTLASSRADHEPVHRVRWVDAGHPAPPPALWPGVVCTASGDDVDAVVVAIDWSRAGEAEATLLTRTLQSIHDAGGTPRYAVQVDIAAGDSPECAASRALGRYFDAWRLGEDLRVNFVDDLHGEAAVLAVRALVSGRLDSVRGQTLQLGGRR